MGADPLAVTGRTRSSRFDAVSTTPAPSSTACTPLQRRLDARATRTGETTRLGGRYLGLIALMLLLWGCTASWRAPVESRGVQPAQPRVASGPRSVPKAPSQVPPAYRVRPGDTLFGIAWDHGLDYREVARWNGIRAPYRIYAGQALRLRPHSAARAQSARPSKPSPSSTVRHAPKAKKTLPRATAKPPASTGRLVWRWPVGGKVSSTFKPSDPLRKGIKISGREGTDIKAAERGRVVYSGSGLIGYGRLIIIKHNDNYLSAYGHNRELLVGEGDQVTKGQRIAAMGRAANGTPLLHFEIRRDGRPVDPLRLLPKR